MVPLSDLEFMVDDSAVPDGHVDPIKQASTNEAHIGSGPVRLVSWDPKKRLFYWTLIDVTQDGEAEMRAVRDVVEGQVSGH